MYGKAHKGKHETCTGKHIGKYTHVGTHTGIYALGDIFAWGDTYAQGDTCIEGHLQGTHTWDVGMHTRGYP
jgi:hypothetical protein